MLDRENKSIREAEAADRQTSCILRGTKKSLKRPRGVRVNLHFDKIREGKEKKKFSMDEQENVGVRNHKRSNGEERKKRIKWGKKKENETETDRRIERQ